MLFNISYKSVYIVHVHIAIYEYKIAEIDVLFLFLECIYCQHFSCKRELTYIATQRMAGIIRSMLKGLIDIPFCENKMNSNARLASQ